MRHRGRKRKTAKRYLGQVVLYVALAPLPPGPIEKQIREFCQRRIAEFCNLLTPQFRPMSELTSLGELVVSWCGEYGVKTGAECCQHQP
jgi:hypothetical protein